MISLEQFKLMIPRNREPEAWYDIAVDFFKKYDINTVNRIAGFMSQTTHESLDFTHLEENLNYSVENLERVFSRYFKKVDPKEYARNPEKLANYVYMDEYRTRSGRLGNVYPGDGWKFRGRGIKQLTGRTNYENFGKFVDLTADEAAEYLETKQGAFESACWFWETNRLARYADKDDIVGMSKRVNGGRIGLQDRIERYEKFKKILNDEIKPKERPKTSIHRIIRRGMVGEDVKMVQRVVGTAVDGVFGPATLVAVKKWQNINGLVPDGIVGPKTLSKMF